MEFTELGKKSSKTLILLPGIACKWQFNFKYVLDELASAGTGLGLSGIK